jgi:hypothetical protein
MNKLIYWISGFFTGIGFVACFIAGVAITDKRTDEREERTAREVRNYYHPYSYYRKEKADV